VEWESHLLQGKRQGEVKSNLSKFYDLLQKRRMWKMRVTFLRLLFSQSQGAIFCGGGCWTPSISTRNILYLFLIFNLLAYYSCTGSTLWHLQKCLQYILVRFTPSIFFLYVPPHLQQFQQLSLFHFYTWIHNTFTIVAFLHPFLMPSSFPLVPTLGKDLFYFIIF
jgi:hypothetical protein